MAWYDGFSNHIYQLEQNPQSYPLAPEDSFVQDYTVRQTTFDQYRILFRIEGDQVILLDFKRGWR